MPKKATQNLCTALAGTAAFLLLFTMLFLSLCIVMNDRSYYLEKYEKLDMQARIGISPEDCSDAIMKLIDYMEGRTNSIDLDVNESGVNVSMYNDRERAHMADVRELFQGFSIASSICLFATVAINIALTVILRRMNWSGSLANVILGRGFIAAVWAFAGIILIVGAWALIDFTNFWTSFHLAFFTNDLWLLNYATDRMIRICPEELFFELIMRFGILFAGATAVLTTVVCIIKKRAERKLKKERSGAQGGAK
jgi:integral membrane protein (TIGR01906 family)